MEFNGNTSEYTVTSSEYRIAKKISVIKSLRYIAIADTTARIGVINIKLTSLESLPNMSNI